MTSQNSWHALSFAAVDSFFSEIFLKQLQWLSFSCAVICLFEDAGLRPPRAAGIVSISRVGWHLQAVVWRKAKVWRIQTELMEFYIWSFKDSEWYLPMIFFFQAQCLKSCFCLSVGKVLWLEDHCPPFSTERIIVIHRSKFCN